MRDWPFEQPLFAACLECALAGACIVGAGFYFRRRGYRGYRLTSRRAAAMGVLTTVLMLATAWWCGLREPPPVTEIDYEMQRLYQQLESNIPPSGGLSFAVRDEFVPTFEGQGWLRGDPPSKDDMAGKIIVVDIWNEL